MISIAQASLPALSLRMTPAMQNQLSPGTLKRYLCFTVPAASNHIIAMLASADRARITTMLGLRSFAPASVRARAGGRSLRATLGALADERLRGACGGDFFSGPVAAPRDRYPAAEARELAVDNAVAFYVASHETTANALTWTTYLLAAQPGLQEELRKEALAALASGGMADLDVRLPRAARGAGRGAPPLPAGAAAGPRGDGGR